MDGIDVIVAKGENALLIRSSLVTDFHLI